MNKSRVSEVDSSGLIKRLSDAYSIQDAIKSILEKQSDSIQYAIENKMIPENIGEINVTVNEIYDNHYEISIHGNGVGLNKSEAENQLATIGRSNENSDLQWSIGVFKMAENGYTFYSNDRRSNNMFVFVCKPSEITYIDEDKIKKEKSDFNLDFFGSKISFILSKKFSISEIGSVFREQSRNIKTRVVYEVQKDSNTREILYFN